MQIEVLLTDLVDQSTLHHRVTRRKEILVKGWMKRIRGAIGMGLTWAAAWFGAGMALLVVVGLDAADVPFPLFFGAIGFVAGVTFSGVLRLAEGRRRFDQMSLPRFAAWGAVGGLVLAGIFVGSVAAIAGERLPLGVLGTIFTLAGAASAAGTLALARMAEDRELLDAGDDVGGVGLSDREERELLGPGD
jgi:hypothetical protein